MNIFFASWIVNAIALYIVARYMPGVWIDKLVPIGGGLITSSGLIILLLSSLILGILNSSLKPFLNLLALPLSIITLGLFTIVITGFVFWLTTFLTPGFHVQNFTSAVLAGVVFGGLNWLISHILGVEEKEDEE